jgi:hypothetical protein
MTNLNAPPVLVSVEMPSDATVTESTAAFDAESTTVPLIVSFIAAAQSEALPANKAIEAVIEEINPAFLIINPFLKQRLQQPAARRTM